MCEYLQPQTLEIAFEPSSVRGARDFLDDCVCPVHGFDRLAEARLVVSELVTNGIQHGAPPVILTVDCQGDQGTLVAVTDKDPEVVALSEPDPLAESGRGVLLVDFISQAWGTRQTEDGKQVWALV